MCSWEERLLLAPSSCFTSSSSLAAAAAAPSAAPSVVEALLPPPFPPCACDTYDDTDADFGHNNDDDVKLRMAFTDTFAGGAVALAVALAGVVVGSPFFAKEGEEERKPGSCCRACISCSSSLIR